MEPTEIQPALESAVGEVLETMCFATALASSEGAAPAEDSSSPPLLTAQLHFQGNPPGQFRVCATSDLARVIAAGFLGQEETEVSEAEAQEVMGELANMICGSVLSRLESDAIFHLSHPEIIHSSRELTPAEANTPDGAGGRRWFDLGAGFFTAAVEFQQTP